MKVAMVGSHPLKITSGTSTHIRELSSHMVKKGVNVDVFCYDTKDKLNIDTPFRIFSYNSKLLSFGDCYNLLSPFFGNFFKKIIKKSKPEILHVNQGFCYGLASLSLPDNIKKITTIHGFGYHHMGIKSIVNPLIKKMLMSSEYVITVNPVLKKEILEYYKLDEDRIQYIPNGVNINRFMGTKKDLRKIYGFNDEKIILFVGALNKRKNVSNLIYAFNMLQKKMQNSIVIIIGSGPEEKNIIRLIEKLKLKKKVILKKNLPIIELQKHYAIADMFVLPSFKEGLPISMLEAMASKLPIIITELKGMDSIVKNRYNCLTLNPFDIHSIENAILTVLKDERLAYDIVKNAFYDVEKKYTWTKVTERTLKIYNQ